MFQNWGFLIGEIVVLLALAALLGLLVGWLIWGRRSGQPETLEADQLKRALDACAAARAEQEAQLARLQDELETARAAQMEAQTVAAARSSDTPAPTPMAAPGGQSTADTAHVGRKPEALAAPRAQGADDLKQIKGIGPKLEKLCNALGFFHFDQIAAWTEEEVAWVDANLEGFKGRVTRDTWVVQAKVLAEGGTTDFSERVKDGDIYD